MKIHERGSRKGVSPVAFEYRAAIELLESRISSVVLERYGRSDRNLNQKKFGTPLIYFQRYSSSSRGAMRAIKEQSFALKQRPKSVDGERVK